MSGLDVHIVDKMVPFATERRRHKYARGGRGSGKSQSISRILASRGIAKRTRWLCCRETQKSIRESTKRLLEGAIEALGLGQYYDVQDQIIYGPHGTQFVFTGLRNHTADSLKSYEDFDGAWIAEAHSVSSYSANILIPTIRVPGSELWWDYNPDQEDDYVHVEANRAAQTNDPDALVVDINWRDNPWFPAELEKERVKLKAINEDLYRHVWEGECRSAAGLLFKRNWFKFYDKLPERLSLYMASDYAGAPDPDSDRQPDYTEHGIAGLDEHGDMYLVDWYSDQAAPETWIEAAVNMIARNRPKIWFEEKGTLLRALDSSITKRLRERDTFIYRYPLASAGNKADRALGFAARASAGAVWLPKTQWAERLLNQLCAFTGEDGRTDDGVDVCSLLARGLDAMTNATKPEKERQREPVPFTKAWMEQDDEKLSDEQLARFYR